MKEEITVIFENDSLRMETVKSFGAKSSEGFWYDQQEEEIAVVSRGYAILEFEDEKKVELKAGEKCVIAPHERHRVAFTSEDCEWICLFFKCVRRHSDTGC